MLSELIAWTESDNNPNAVRFEPAHVPSESHIAAMATGANCSHDTARVLCAMSWGLYQIMGDELISMGFSGNPIAFCADPALQLQYFDRYLRLDHLSNLSLDEVVHDQDKRELFAHMYNGPGNIKGYSARLVAVYCKLKGNG